MARGLLLFVAFSAVVALRVPSLAPGSRRAVAPRMASLDDAIADMDNVGGNPQSRIQQMIDENKVMLFMKGNKMFPQCGFSNTAVMILKSITPDFETFDVLSDSEIREGVKQFSNWPTIPQCYIGGEFIGGCDLLIEMYQSGELQEEVEKAMAS